MACRRCGATLRAVSTLLLFLSSLAEGPAEAEPVKVGDSIFLRVKQTGACVTVEEDSTSIFPLASEDVVTEEKKDKPQSSSSVHAAFWHHGLWQELKVNKADGKEGDVVSSGDKVHLRGHNGAWVEVFSDQVMAVKKKPPTQGLTIEKESGDGPIRVGDTIYLKSTDGKYLLIKDMDVIVGGKEQKAEQAFVVDTHMVGPWDGRWTRESEPGKDVFVIQGSTLHFVDTIEFGMFPQGHNKFTTGLTGWKAHDAGELIDGKIQWTNGDVWIRTKGDFDGRWTDSMEPGAKIFIIEGETLKHVGGDVSSITPSKKKFKTAYKKAPASDAELVGTQLHWSNGDVWVPLASGRFDGRWTVKVNPGGDFFDIEGDMLFFDPGLESRIYENGRSFKTEIDGGNHLHQQATLTPDGKELHWNNGDIWSRFHEPLHDFWAPPEVLAQTSTTTTVTRTTATITNTTTTVTKTATVTTTTTVATTSTVTTITTVTATATRLCFEESVAYEPLDMDGPSGHASYENGAEACQARCQRTAGCTHFTYWSLANPGHCHLQDIYALRSTFRLGFIAGPPHCFVQDERTKNGLVQLGQKDVGPETYVPYAFRCLKMSRMYAPIMYTTFLTRDKGFLSGKMAVKGCRQLCLNTTGCSYYSIGFPARACSLSPANAKEVKAIIKHMAGPVHCEVEDFAKESDVISVNGSVISAFSLDDFDDEELPTDAGDKHHRLGRILIGFGACSLAGLVALAAMGRSFRRRLQGASPDGEALQGSMLCADEEKQLRPCAEERSWEKMHEWDSSATQLL